MLFYGAIQYSVVYVTSLKKYANTIIATKEMMEACGFKSIEDVKAFKLYRRD
jgi:hypothetical protein